MSDEEIIALFCDRSERAISETDARYGRYCRSIAFQILGNREDAEECVSDAYLSAWNAIPPRRPAVLAAFLGRLTRQAAIDRWRTRSREKRGGGELPLALDELAEVVGGGKSPETAMLEKELVSGVNRFLDSLPPMERRIFLCRYWYLDSVSDIAEHTGYPAAKVATMLFRMRGKLKKQLMKEGLL